MANEVAHQKHRIEMNIFRATGEHDVLASGPSREANIDMEWEKETRNGKHTKNVEQKTQKHGSKCRCEMELKHNGTCKIHDGMVKNVARRN